VTELLPMFAFTGPWLVALYLLAGVAYYEKWYSSASKSELVPYESTEATLRLLTPSGGKYIYASPMFWTPFHDEADTAFYSYAEAQPIERDGISSLAGAANDKPIVLLVDEMQWLAELTTGVSQPATSWQRDWVSFIEKKCILGAVAYGTAHGTVAEFECGLRQAPLGHEPPRTVGIDGAYRLAPRVIGGEFEYLAGNGVLTQDASQLAGWTKYDDPRRTSTAQPSVSLSAGSLKISGTGWPGIVKMIDVTPGDAYLVNIDTSMTRDGDLLYLGTWQQPQVRSMSGASSSGIPAPLIAPPWFPHDRAFVATASQVRVLVYSEAPSTDFTISSLEVIRLVPAFWPETHPSQRSWVTSK
jgi:hypothetical protein